MFKVKIHAAKAVRPRSVQPKILQCKIENTRHTHRHANTHTYSTPPFKDLLLVTPSLSLVLLFSLSLLFDFLCHFVGAAPPCINQRRLERQCPSTDDTKHNNFCCCCVRRHCRQHRQSEHLLSPHPCRLST